MWDASQARHDLSAVPTQGTAPLANAA